VTKQNPERIKFSKQKAVYANTKSGSLISEKTIVFSYSNFFEGLCKQDDGEF
jgi:hypothetical protein